MKFRYNNYRINNLQYKINPEADQKRVTSPSDYSEVGQTSLSNAHLRISKEDANILFTSTVKVQTQLNDEEKTNYRSVLFDLMMTFLIEDSEVSSEHDIFEMSRELVMAVVSARVKEIVRQISLLDYLPAISIQSFSFPDSFEFEKDKRNP